MIAKIYDALFETVPEEALGGCTGCAFERRHRECDHPEIRTNVGCSDGHFIFKPHDAAARAWVVAKALTR